MLYYFKLFDIPAWVKDPKAKAATSKQIGDADSDDGVTFQNSKESYKRNVSSSSSSKNSSSKRMKNDKSSRQTEKKENHPRCEGCGRYHGGTKAECMCRNHPDFNHSKALWEQSTIGLKYASLQRTHIDFKKRLNLQTNVFEDSNYEPASWRRERREVSLFLLNNIKINNSDIIYLRSEIIPGVEAKVLLDTGAQSNFISKDFFNILNNNQLLLNRILTDTSIRVCSAFAKCLVTKEIVSFKIRIVDPVTNIAVDLANLQAHIVDTLPCEVVVGRKSIAANNLISTFHAHLCGYSNSLEGMEPGTCVEGTPEALLTESKVSEMCTCVTTPVLLTNSKSQRLLDYSRMSGKQLEINLLQFRKEELLGIESDEDHVDEYIDKYD
jgi:ribosomal protein S14